MDLENFDRRTLRNIRRVAAREEEFHLAAYGFDDAKRAVRLGDAWDDDVQVVRFGDRRGRARSVEQSPPITETADVTIAEEARFTLEEVTEALAESGERRVPEDPC